MKNRELAAFLEKSNEIIRKQKLDNIVQTPFIARKALESLMSYTGEAPFIALSMDRFFNSGDRFIPVRIYHPEPDNVLPVMVFIHGGGHVCGSIEIYDVICRKLSIACRCVLVAVEYRLAPENPYPAGLDDCRDVLKGIEKILEGIKADPERLVLAGDSGGGAMTATIAALDAGRTLPRLSAQILVYPSLDYTKSSESYIRYGKGFLLETERIDWYFERYFRNGENPEKCSPLFLNPSDLPPTLVISAEYDPLAGDSVKYADMLAKAGIQIEFHEYTGMIHAFLCIEKLVPETVSDAYKRIAAFFGRVVSLPVS